MISSGSNKAVIAPIFKTGSQTQCENLWRMSLLGVAYKVYAKIIINRLRPIIDTITLEEQSGFRKENRALIIYLH